ncbi:MAG: polysaccharide biosynthesis protein [Clostridiales bacterium]|jgi:stage V sporulation protein B|nr:polysaccharide biosynthesis protein [Clostridiales bacterium]
MKRKGIVFSALILTLAGVITRLLGFVYRIYMSNIIGAEGIGLYQLITPLYSLAWSISCSGFTTTISKYTAQERAKKEYGNMGLILKQCVIITSGIGFILSLVFYFFTDLIAINVLHEPRTILALKILSLCFPFMAAGSSIRGYFFGLQESTVPAISQVVEQCVRMAVVFSLAGLFMPLGLEYACAAAIIGIAVGEVISFIYVFVAYKKFKTKNTLTKKPSYSPSKSLNLILLMAFPLTLNRVTSSLLSTVENILIPQRLILYGATAAQSMAQYGQLAGMAMPLVYFPTAFLVALSISLVPAVSEATALKNTTHIKSTIKKILLSTMVLGFGAAALFSVFSKVLGLLIYKQDIGDMLFFLGVMCPFLYLQVVLSGILNGLGQQAFIFRNSLVSSAINIGFIYFLTPFYGVYAFILGWFVSLIFVTLLELLKIKSTLGLDLDLFKWFILPAICSLASGLSVNLVYIDIISIFGGLTGFIISALILALSYLALILLTGCIELKDLTAMFKKIKIFA